MTGSWITPFEHGPTLSYEEFAPNLSPGITGGAPWGFPDSLITTEGSRVLRHDLDDDHHVAATTELTTEPAVAAIAPFGLPLRPGVVAHTSYSEDGTTGTILFDASTAATLSIHESMRPLAAGDLTETGGPGLMTQDVGEEIEGWTLAFLSSPTGPEEEPSFTVVLPAAPRSSFVGPTNAVAITDFDGDGHDDLALGYPAARSDGLPHRDRRGEGRVLIYRGPLEPGDYGPEHADLVLLVDDPAVEDFGEALLAADTDEDGIPELLVGAPGTDDQRGAAYRFDDVMRPWRELNGID